MLGEVKLSVIVPTYNAGEKIKPCLSSLENNLEFLSIQTNLIYEILIINDGGDEIDLKFLKNIDKIKQHRLRKNKGVGYARQLGFKISKYDYLFYLDSDVVMENKDTLKILFDDFLKDKSIGSIGASQSYNNLNTDYSSNFVAAKTCYGFEEDKLLYEFSGMRSECGLMEKNFLELIGGWKFFPAAGGEEFDLGHRVTKNGKKNIISKKTNYTTFYDNIFTRCRTIIYRTSNYLPILISKKKFESKGAFATLSQAISVFITSIMLVALFLSFFFPFIENLVFILLLFNLIVEFSFLKFVMKYYNKSGFPLYIMGIYLINISIIIGVLIGFFKLKPFLKKFNY